jgi:hypothetical protein
LEHEAEIGLENPASPWFAARRPLALPTTNSAAIEAPAEEAGREAARTFPWFG